MLLKNNLKLGIVLFVEVATMSNSPMKTILSTSALAAILSLALVGTSAQAQTPTTTPAPSTTSPAPAKVKKSGKIEYKGTVTAIDPSAKTITVQGSKATITLSIASTTTFKKDGKPATLEDFTVGEKVTGSYAKGATGVLTACSVHTKTAMAKTTKPKPTTPASTTSPAPAAQ
jgi:phage baseplate assembly protein gpV